MARAQGRVAPSDRVMVGLIGVGVRGRDHHLRFLSANPRVEIAAICDVDRSRADLAAQIADDAPARRSHWCSMISASSWSARTSTRW